MPGAGRDPQRRRLVRRRRCARSGVERPAARRGPRRARRGRRGGAARVPGAGRRRPQDRPRARLLHRHRLRDPARRLRVASARSAPAAATTRWPATGRRRYPGVGHLARRDAGCCAAARRPAGSSRPAASVPTCVLVAVPDEESRAASDDVAAALRARGIAHRGGAERRQVRQADPLRRAARASRSSGSPAPTGRRGQGHPHRRPGRGRPGRLGSPPQADLRTAAVAPGLARRHEENHP